MHEAGLIVASGMLSVAFSGSYLRIVKLLSMMYGWQYVCVLIIVDVVGSGFAVYTEETVKLNHLACSLKGVW